MKNFAIKLLLIISVVSSCQTSNSVVSKFGIQKRKYNKGWAISKPKINTNIKSSSKNKSIHTVKDSIIKIDSKKENLIGVIKKGYHNKTKTESIISVKKSINPVISKIIAPKKNKIVMHYRKSTVNDCKHNKIVKKSVITYKASDKIVYEDLSWFYKILLLVLGVILIVSILLCCAYFSFMFEVLALLIVPAAIFIPLLVGMSFMFEENLPFGEYYWHDVFVLSGWLLTIIALIFGVILLMSLTASQWLSILIALIAVAIIALILAILVYNGGSTLMDIF